MPLQRLVELTKLCHDATVDDVRKIMPEITKGLGAVEYAIVSGILVHGPEGSHYFWQGGAEVIKEGVTKDVCAEVQQATRQDYLPTMVRYLAKKPDGDLICQEIDVTPSTPEVM